MRVAQWTTVAVMAALGTLTIIRHLSPGPDGTGDPTRPDRGRLAPLLHPPPRRRTVVRMEGDRGAVMDLSTRGDTIAILTRSGWILQADHGLREWKGDPTPGSPDWLSRPTAIALGPDRLFVLDPGRGTVLVWDTAGDRQADLLLPSEEEMAPPGRDIARRPSQLLLAPGGLPIVTRQRVAADGTGLWEILGFDSAGSGRKIRSIRGPSRGMVFREPLLAVAGSALLGIDPLSHEVSRIDPETGSIEPLGARFDPPLWRIPNRLRRRYNRRIRSLGGPAPEFSELPAFWPSVRAFSVRKDGSFLVAVTAGEDHQHLEVLTPDLRPLGRFQADGVTDPLFLSEGRAFTVEERPQETVIHELLFDPR